MANKRGERTVGRDVNGDYFDFGKHIYHYVKWVALKDASYLKWVLRQNFPDKVKAACREALLWASEANAVWSGPERAEHAASVDRARFNADVNRIWREKDDD